MQLFGSFQYYHFNIDVCFYTTGIDNNLAYNWFYWQDKLKFYIVQHIFEDYDDDDNELKFLIRKIRFPILYLLNLLLSFRHSLNHNVTCKVCFKNY